MSQHSSFLAVDKNKLMKERVRMEKVKKCDKRPNSNATVPQPSQKKKQKHPGNSAGDQDKEKRLKEKDVKIKKKEEEKQRQALLIETRKAQAEARWASKTPSSYNSPEGQEVMVTIGADAGVRNAPPAAESYSSLPSVGERLIIDRLGDRTSAVADIRHQYNPMTRTQKNAMKLCNDTRITRIITKKNNDNANMASVLLISHFYYLKLTYERTSRKLYG
ncbi:hypothetical protein P5673_026905 [Acropora cervicornis]|uniref:Uncharacterized protein n=1 Tax=Acropora cervicornis TaxID=6130 RepID=A0AAD9Q028_ACRCE|nr:hypothetical protein P5673_026905 [Acropora cervicornis]